MIKNKNQTGMTLLEVMIALVITVTGTLGSVALQASAKKGSFDSMQRSLATSLAQDIIERMRNNDRSTLALYASSSAYGDGKTNAIDSCKSASTLCTPAQMVQHDLYGWEQSIMGADAKSGTQNTGGLADGKACISHSNNAVTVIVTWQGRTDLADGVSTEDDELDGNGAIVKVGESRCGSASTDLKRRQVIINAFIY